MSGLLASRLEGQWRLTGEAAGSLTHDEIRAFELLSAVLTDCDEGPDVAATPVLGHDRRSIRREPFVAPLAHRRQHQPQFTTLFSEDVVVSKGVLLIGPSFQDVMGHQVIQAVGENVAGDAEIAIAEDSAILRDGLAQLLAGRGFDVIDAVGDPEALRDAVGRALPDVAVIDIRMPPTFTDEGLRLAIELRHDHPQLGILLFSQYVETRYAAELLADGAGGIGYLLKDRVADVSDFVEALVRVASGGTALDPEVVTQLMGASRRRDSLSGLSGREREVLALMAEGRTNAAIATTLVISEGAVEKHVTSIFTKLNLPVSQLDHRRVLAVLRYLDS